MPLAVAIGLVATLDPADAGGLVGTRAAYAASVAPQPSLADATAVRIETDSSSTKLVFALSAPVVANAFLLANPDRAIVDLPQIDFRIDPAAGRLHDRRGRGARHGLVTSYRFGLLSPGRSRIVIDLGAPARVSAGSARKVGDHYELAVVLSRTDHNAFRAAAQHDVATPTAHPATVAATPHPLEKVTIVLDPGHGGPDTGAIVNGVVEKDIALAFALALATKLEAYGAFNVVMTRSSDVFIPLGERVGVARSAKAALMVSIHADTLNDAAAAADISGATVYTVSDKASDAYAAKVAAKENSADAAVGLDGQPDTADVNDILFDLTRQETRAYSHVFARTLVNYWKLAGRLNKNPRRAAGFVVLKAPDVPSVLLELGYLSSPADSASLTSDAWRDQAAGRMAEAIEAYFSGRQGPAKAAAGVPMPLKQAAIEPRDVQK